MTNHLTPRPQLLETYLNMILRSLSVTNGVNPPDGWLGKPHACHLLSQAATGSVLVFVDADVILEPTAIAACVELLRDKNFGLVAPYPQQLADTSIERLVQPLVTWSWVATMPLGIAETSLRPSLSAANGQFLIFDSLAYTTSGGHARVKGEVLEDIALMRSLKLSGYQCATVNGSELAHCRMYEGARLTRERLHQISVERLRFPGWVGCRELASCIHLPTAPTCRGNVTEKVSSRTWNSRLSFRRREPCHGRRQHRIPTTP